MVTTLVRMFVTWYQRLNRLSDFCKIRYGI